MNDANNTCPYCNAVLQVLTPQPPDMMLPCPRCNEPVAASRWGVDASLNSAKSKPTSSARPPGIRKTLFIVLGIMFTMALIGLSFALWTTQLRQSRHPWLHTKLDPIAFRQPLELPGLGYLPTNCAFVAGLHIGEMVEDAKVGRPLLSEPRPVGLDWALRQIYRTTGMKAEDIDHVVVGGRTLSEFSLVVKARRKISLEKVGDARPKKSYLHRDRATYEFTLQAGAEAIVWQADDQTLVYLVRFPIGPDITSEEYLKQMNVKARPIEEVIPTGLREMIQQRLAKHHFAWLAGDTAGVGIFGPFLAVVGEQHVAALAETKRLALGVTPINGLTILGNLQVGDTKAAGKLVTMLEKAKLPEGISRKIEVTPPEQPQHWVTLQLRGDVAAMGEWFGTKK